MTPADVISETIKWFEKRGTFTSCSFHQPKGAAAWTSESFPLWNRPGEHVGRTCAIGGVEQAIWRLTGEDVSDLRDEVGRAQKTQRRTLYARTMTLLNKTAVKIEPKNPAGTANVCLEDLTFYSRKTAKQRVLKVLHAALEETKS